MKKTLQFSDRLEVARHLHDHITVTRSELDAFANDDDDVQLLVLAELRSRAADQETSLILTLEAAAVAIIAVMLSRVPVAEPDTRESSWVSAVVFSAVCIALAALTIVLVAPSIWQAVKGNRDHARATVWLSTYEQALAERRSTPAVRSGRRWLRLRRH